MLRFNAKLRPTPHSLSAFLGVLAVAILALTLPGLASATSAGIDSSSLHRPHLSALLKIDGMLEPSRLSAAREFWSKKDFGELPPFSWGDSHSWGDSLGSQMKAGSDEHPRWPSVDARLLLIQRFWEAKHHRHHRMHHHDHSNERYKTPVVPEPTTAVLMLLGLSGLSATTRRSRSARQSS